MEKYFIQYKGEKTFSEITKDKALNSLKGYYKNIDDVLKNSNKHFPAETCFSYIWREVL